MKTLGTAARGLLAAVALAMAGTAAVAQDGVGKNSITIGQSIVLAGLGASIARPYHEGAKLNIDRVNAAGGVGGRRIDVVTLDDNGRSVTTVANTKKLLEQGVFCLFGYYGSPQVTAAYPLIKDSDVLLFAPMTAADDLRGPDFPHVYSLRPGFAVEAAAIARHAETLGARKLAIIHAPDPESLEALASAERTMPKLGATLVAKAAATSSGNVANAVDTVLAAKPESMLVIGDANSAANVVRDLRAKGFRGAIYGFSNTGESLLAEELGPDGAGVVVVRVVPKTENPTSIVARELQADAAAAKAGKPNVYMLEGYIAARVLVEALRRMPGEPSRSKFKRSLATLQDVNVGSFRVDLTQGRVASRLVELALIDSQGRVRE
jgi:ABC-type branched-subunit amino acid transport system substrate-binding protein